MFDGRERLGLEVHHLGVRWWDMVFDSALHWVASRRCIQQNHSTPLYSISF